MIAKAVAKRVLTALVLAAAVGFAIWRAPALAVAVALAALWALGAAECAAMLARRLPPRSPRFAAAFAACAVALGAALYVLWLIFGAGGNALLLFTVAAVKASDMAGFAFGLAFGRHKLCPSISPNKTWEGLAGSILASALVCVFAVPRLAPVPAAAFGAGIALLATAGDLAESSLKRFAGVKDSSAFRFTNGLGGILDMLDSLLLAPSAILLFLAA